MSYILEALRKVERQRDHSSVHSLSSPQRYRTVVTTVAPNLRTLMLVAAMATGALVASILSVNLTLANRYVQPGPQSAAQSVLAAAEVGRGSPDPRTHEKEQDDMADSESGQSSVPHARMTPALQSVGLHQNPAGEAAAQKVRQDGAVAPRSEEKIIPSHPTESATQRVEHPSARHTMAASLKRIDLVKDIGRNSGVPSQLKTQPAEGPPVGSVASNSLPATKKINEVEMPPSLSSISSQIQGGMPKIAIDGVIYSPEPKQRVVVINTKLYSEGQVTPEGVTIETIHQDGVICSYQGHLFRLSR